MEGCLVKWTNIISRWKKRYVVIDKDKFTYYKRKGGKVQGSHLLRGVVIEMVHSDPAGFLLQFENGEVMQFRANDAGEKQKWLVAIQAGKILAGERVRQDNVLHTIAPDAVMTLKTQLIDILRNRILNGSSKLSKDMAGIMSLQEQLENTVNDLLTNLKKNGATLPPGVAECAEIIQKVSQELRVSIFEMLKSLPK